jgi:branched-chain amino acid transport system ATP-binding protein
LAPDPLGRRGLAVPLSQRQPERAMTPLLEVEGLEVVYGRAIRAIQGVSFSVGEGRIVGLVGLNGAGKTTTIRAISGFLPTENVRITDGRLRFAGKAIERLRPYQAARLGIAVVPERDKVFDTLTVRENLELALVAASSSGDEPGRCRRYRSIEDIFDLFVPLASRSDQDAILLSGGERQMLAIGACLLSCPRLLIVDEASLGLAPLMRRHVFDMLAQLNRDLGLTVLIVDQDVGGVLSIADHGYILENGRVVFAGTREQLLRHGDVKEFYLGQKEERERGYRHVKQYRRIRRWH